MTRLIQWQEQKSYTAIPNCMHAACPRCQLKLGEAQSAYATCHTVQAALPDCRDAEPCSQPWHHTELTGATFVYIYSTSMRAAIASAARLVPVCPQGLPRVRHGLTTPQYNRSSAADTAVRCSDTWICSPTDTHQARFLAPLRPTLLDSNSSIANKFGNNLQVLHVSTSPAACSFLPCVWCMLPCHEAHWMGERMETCVHTAPLRHRYM